MKILKSKENEKLSPRSDETMKPCSKELQGSWV